MEKILHLTVITPDGTELETDAEYVNLPSAAGSVGILPGHAPMVCALEKGTIRYRTGGKTFTFEVTGGIAEVRRNNVTVLR